MIELPVGRLPVDFLTLVMSHFRNLAGKPDGRDQGFQATIMKSSEDEVREKEIAFLQGNFDNVRFSENYCFAVHKGEAESLTDLIDRYLSLNSTSFIQAEKHVKEKNHKRYSPNAQPIFEHNRGNIPITFFGVPFTVESSESRHCIHGSLKAIDKDSRGRLYFDPFERKSTAQVTCSPSLKRHLEDLSVLVDVKTGWKVANWPLIQPRHCQQRDGYNCGVFVCLFSRCLVQGLDFTFQFNMQTERRRLLSTLFGSCYDDIHKGRNIAVCKIFKQDDNEDWLGCDRCGQFFHTSCLGVDFAITLCQTFYCVSS